MNIFDSFRLDGRRALVTGSSRGIGLAIANALADAGATVVFHGTADTPKLRDAVAAATAAGHAVECATADLSDPSQVTRLAKEVGPVDILVLNASVQKYQSLDHFEPGEFARQYQVNVAASLQLIEAVLPSMREKKWGRILAIGSVNQERPAPRLPIYASTKAALANIVLSAAKQNAPYGITVNDIAPGIIATDRNAAALSDPERLPALRACVPAGRFGTAGDCAGIALLLCTDAASYITGAVIPVSGGMHL